MTDGDSNKVFNVELVFRDENDPVMIEESLKELYPDLERVDVVAE